VGVLALHQDVLHVFIEIKVAPSGTTFREKKTYTTASGCRKTEVPLTQLQTVLPTLSKAHLGAMSIAAKRKPVKGIREAHSSGVIEYLSEFVHKPVPGPSYQASLTKAMLRKRKRFLAQEGKLKKFTLLKRERDPNVRANALAEREPKCQLCRFDFAETYGAFAMNCVEVHHIKGLAGAGKRGVTTTLDDVLVVCPNCHRALHQYKNPNDWKAFQKACRLG
jgi:5-methylcytosine-specific restriction endonuclease McrA